MKPKKIRRNAAKVAASLSISMLFVLSFAGVSYAGNDGGQVVEKTVTETVHIKASIEKVAHLISADADPPGGGCEGLIQFDTTGYYLNGVLTDTVSIYYGNVYCTTTAEGQFMAELSSYSTMYLNGNFLSEAETGICYDCNRATSTNRGYCVQGPQQCAGAYAAQNTITMLLPDGWIWTAPPWSGCVLIGPPETLCTVHSDSAYIPPVY